MVRRVYRAGFDGGYHGPVYPGGSYRRDGVVASSTATVLVAVVATFGGSVATWYFENPFAATPSFSEGVGFEIFDGGSWLVPVSFTTYTDFLDVDYGVDVYPDWDWRATSVTDTIQFDDGMGGLLTLLPGQTGVTIG